MLIYSTAHKERILKDIDIIAKIYYNSTECGGLAEEPTQQRAESKNPELVKETGCCVRVRVRACVRACVRVRVCVCVCVWDRQFWETV